MVHAESDNEVADCLDKHAPNDQRFSSYAVGQRTGDDLSGAPNPGINGFNPSVPSHTDADGGEKQGKTTPGHAALRVVDKSTLETGKHGFIRPSDNSKVLCEEEECQLM